MMPTKTRRARISLVVLLAVLPISTAGADPVAAARRNAEQAREALRRSRRVLDAYVARMDSVTRLLPRSGRSAAWYVADSAADLYPFLAMAAYFTDRSVFEREMHEILRQEILLSTRVGMLSDNVLAGGKGFEHPAADLARIIFGSCEYAKDGLLPLGELLGHRAWQERLISIADGLIEHAPHETRFGRVPSLSAEVNGELLQVLSRLAHLSRESRYADQAVA
ncbi:MAG: hypothetical protein JXA90_12465, partial [Planctomycetes bacterium]|nr:hypothetical protein [Planctomycetota bacterium]